MLQGYNNLKEFKLLLSTSEFIPLQTNDRYFPNWPQSVGQNLSISAISAPGGEEQRWSEPTFTELLLSGTTCNVMKPAQVNIVIMPSLLMRKQRLMPVGKEVAKIAVKGSWAVLVAQMVKNLPAMWETWAHSLGWEDPLEEGTATHCNILAWRIPMDRGACQATVHGVAKSQT